MHSEYGVSTPCASWDEERLAIGQRGPDHVLGRTSGIERPANAHINPRTSGEYAERDYTGGNNLSVSGRNPGKY